MTEIMNGKKEYDRSVQRAAKLIIAGDVVAFPTETVYGLGGDAMDPQAVKKIFQVKGRPADNPLIVHICEIAQTGLVALEIPTLAHRLMEAFWPGPFTAVLKKQPGVPHITTGGLDSVAVRMPHSSLARDIIRESGRLVAAPSANLSGRPSPTTAQHVWDDLQGKIPLIVDGGACAVGVESTVCDVRGEVPVILRPGGITAEMIREVAGSVRVHPAVLSETLEQQTPSPGMRYRHYAPRALITLVAGKDSDIADKINQMYFETPEHCVIICMHEHCSRYEGKNYMDLGADQKDAAKNLFTVLRNIDKMGYKAAFFHAVETDELGLALMNRMLRAAGHTITAAGEDCID